VSLKNESAAGTPSFNSSYILKQVSSDGKADQKNVSGTISSGNSQNILFNVVARGSPGKVIFSYLLYDDVNNRVSGKTNNGNPLCQTNVTWKPPELTCGALNATDAIEAGTPFKIAPAITFKGWYIDAPSPPAYRMTLDVDTYHNANQPYTPTIAPPIVSQVQVSPAQVITINSAGIYTVNWSLVGTYGKGCSTTIKVALYPYFGVYNGDVRSGAKFKESDGVCVDPNASGTYKGVAAFNQGNGGTGGNYAGSGADVAAIATDKIYGFVSANKRAGPGPPNGLTFSNFQSISGDMYGGSFNSGPCTIDDYWSLSRYGTVHTGPYPINGITLGANSKQDIFVNGNVFITDNIQYAGSPWSVGNIPYFRLIVHGGNIYIKNTVTQLDGLYVAIPDNNGNGGTIYTCSTSATRPSPAEVASTSICGAKQLTVNGAFIANQVKLLRTWGTLRNANTADGRTNLHAAEKFIYTPELWLGTPATSSTEGYDAITSLPPIL
jgi:hypothetical protein